MTVLRTTDTNMDKSLVRDVDSMIALVAYEKTPFYSSMSMGKATQLLVEKLEDVLDDAGENAHVEGADTTFPAREAPTLVQNRVQRFEKSFQISEDLDITDKYGRKTEFSRLNNLKMKELARDIEYACLNGALQAGTDSVPAKMDGVLNLTNSENDFDFNNTFADTNHITFGILLDTLQSIYEFGADPNMIITPPNQKRKVSAFQSNERITANVNATSKELNLVVDVLETDFGTVFVMNELFFEPEVDATPDPDVNYDQLVAWDSTKISCKTFRNLKREELAKTGDSRKWRMTTSKTILPDSKKAFGKITKLTQKKLTNE